MLSWIYRVNDLLRYVRLLKKDKWSHFTYIHPSSPSTSQTLHQPSQLHPLNLGKVSTQHPKNICRNSMDIADAIKASSPPNPFFVHPHIHIPLHFRPTPFGPSLWPLKNTHPLLMHPNFFVLILLPLSGWRF